MGIGEFIMCVNAVSRFVAIVAHHIREDEWSKAYGFGNNSVGSVVGLHFVCLLLFYFILPIDWSLTLPTLVSPIGST